jgi:1-acyl-sn-glycerol-3-phosphate acyltransferase
MTKPKPRTQAHTPEQTRFTSSGMARLRYVAQRGLLKPLVWRLTRVTVQGKERIASLDGPFIAVANHSSHLDAPLMFGAMPRDKARYLAAGAAADYFFDVKWRKWLTALFFNAFPVDRDGSRTRPGVSKKLLDLGVPLLIFPEGGRSKDGALGRFKAGAAALSMSADVPCVPVALVGASSAMPRGRNWPLPGRMPVTVVFGSPMRALDGESADDFAKRLRDAVRDLHLTVAPLPTSHAITKGTR